MVDEQHPPITDPAIDFGAPLLDVIERFLSITGMAPSTLGKVGVGNSEIVARERRAKRIGRPPRTSVDVDRRLRAFMAQRLEIWKQKQDQKRSAGG